MTACRHVLALPRIPDQTNPSRQSSQQFIYDDDYDDEVHTSDFSAHPHNCIQTRLRLSPEYLVHIAK